MWANPAEATAQVDRPERTAWVCAAGARPGWPAQGDFAGSAGQGGRLEWPVWVNSAAPAVQVDRPDGTAQGAFAGPVG
ncbi:hypothetical protein [Streptomyces sp. NPDC006638]|uniref:hypothetical protein n=1 Tax=Streptomyces sp. NPDC006638 TaxID=3157183 RepID=UPI00339EA947